MRIATSTLFDVNVATLNRQQSKLLQTQQQVSLGRRMLTPADDPAAAALALDVSQADAANTQHGSNIDRAQTALALSEGVLQGVTLLLQDVQTIAVNAGNGSLSNADRKMLASDLQGRLDELVVQANHTDATGNYLFAGFQGNTSPFINTASGVQYRGDDGKRMVQVSTAGQVATSDSGADIFMRIKNGNGAFVIQPAAANTGSGIASVGMAVNPALLTGDDYQVTFNVAAGGVTTYDVTNTTTATVVSSGNPYTSGQAITFDGLQFDITGTPANGDQFDVAPSTNESVFKTVSDLIDALNAGVTPGDMASATEYNANLNRALNGLARGLDNILTVRASIGSRMKQLDSEKLTVSDLGLQYQQVLSQLQDLDYNKAITDLTQQQTSLQAAQKSFLQVQNLSMFNYM
ncbi:Flagellar hook-associated protein 3 [Gallionellaceae bacterium]|nr:Flagellar hook-associated protein 3 [Gallionellaceae bacterium]